MAGACLLYWINTFWSDRSVEKGAFVVHCAGTIAMLAAIFSGREDQTAVNPGSSAESILQNHEISAYILIWFFIMMVVWQYLRQGRAPKWEKITFSFVFSIGIGFMFYSAHLGGRLVFEEGVGLSSL